MTSEEIQKDFDNCTRGSRSGGRGGKSRGFTTYSMRERATLTGVAIKPKFVNNGKTHILRRPSK